MDEDIAIIDSNTRNEKIKKFFINYKKLLISLLVLVITLLISYFIFEEFIPGREIQAAIKLLQENGYIVSCKEKTYASYK